MNPSPAVIVNDFISLFFPRTCAGCDNALVKGEELICTRCIVEMPRSNYHLERDNEFYRKLQGRIPVKYVMSFLKFVKAGRVQHILHELKYKNKPELGRLLGRTYGTELKNSGYENAFDLIVPIPLHPVKKKRRGYNQSEEFGKGLADVLKVECSEEYLSRGSVTETQTKKSRLRRWENVRHVFYAVKPDALKGRRILLVDDVVTTGATLEAASLRLVDAGCGELSIGCIAATQ